MLASTRYRFICILVGWLVLVWSARVPLKEMLSGGCGRELCPRSEPPVFALQLFSVHWQQWRDLTRLLLPPDLTFNSDFICSEPHGPLNVDDIIFMASLLSVSPKIPFCLDRNIEILWNTKVEGVALKSHSNPPDVISVN